MGSLTLSPFLDGDGPSRRADLCRAVLEGLAFVLRANAEQVAAVVQAERPRYTAQAESLRYTGANLEQVAAVAQADSLRYGMTGGLTRSPFWVQLVADVLGAPIRVSEIPEGTALGAAVCAGVAAGLFADLAEGAQHLARVRA
ncbi:MAG: FGGY-family carbohydrate kinase, partial [Acidobacteriota bacterium]|nr:FGGY-family carbohydrate kinase [Acidobacteriota bacterium]